MLGGCDVSSVQTKITYKDGKYYGSAFLDLPSKKTHFVISLPDYAKKRVHNYSANQQWVLKGAFIGKLFVCSSLKALTYSKKSVVNHKPLYEGNPFNPAKTKSRNKIGLGINTTEKSITTQIIKASNLKEDK